jgi:hypothetical protein
MKTTLVIRKLLVGAACGSFLVGTAAIAAGNASYGKDSANQQIPTAPKNLSERVVLVRVTGSWIPQRVVLRGTQVDSASPLFVVQGSDLLRSGGSTVQSILSRDPSITFSRVR